MKPTLRLTPDEAGLACAAELLRAGELVAFPSETVYGLGGDARRDESVAAIYAAKGRPSHNPLIVHVPDLETAKLYAEFSPEAEAVARAFWPGPLTLVLPLRAEAGLSPRITAGHGSVAIRVPGHPVALALLRAAQVPMAGPSANPSGRISPTTAQHVLDGLDGRIAAVLDGGPCRVGVESTIVAPDAPPRLLRPGSVSAEDILAVLGELPLRPEADPERPLAPGQLSSHYAPDALVRLNADRPVAGEIFIGFGPGEADFQLSESADLAEAAANLFAVLREADLRAGPGGRIAVAPVPVTGVGLAINDRLIRAAAPR